MKSLLKEEEHGRRDRSSLSAGGGRIFKIRMWFGSITSIDFPSDSIAARLRSTASISHR
jgi:hypothetical protein